MVVLRGVVVDTVPLTAVYVDGSTVAPMNARAGIATGDGVVTDVVVVTQSDDTLRSGSIVSLRMVLDHVVVPERVPLDAVVV